MSMRSEKMGWGRHGGTKARRGGRFAAVLWGDGGRRRSQGFSLDKLLLGWVGFWGGMREAMNNAFAEVAGEVAARRSVVVATVVRESGSVPRRTGAKMIVR